MYLVCKRYSKKECYIEENKEQGVILNKRLKEMKWYRCIGKAVQPREKKV